MKSKGNIIALVNNSIWAILPEYLDTIHNILYAKYFGNGINIEQVELDLGRKLENKFEVSVHSVASAGSAGTAGQSSRNSSKKVAVIPVYGVIAKRMNMFSEVSGGTSTELLKKSIGEALNNPDIDAIVLDVESRGGTVDGTKELADFIYQNRGMKPMLSHANGMMASAAYWIGSAVDRVTAFDTASVGSIGVVTAHYDYSKYEEQIGVKTTYIYAGKYKVMGNDSEPLSKEAKNYIQGQLDDVYTMFVDSVAQNRGVTPKEVLAKMADGKIFLAKDALEAGLIDDMMTLEQTIELAASMAAGDIPNKEAVAVLHTEDKSLEIPDKGHTKEVQIMDKKTLKEQHPDLYTAVIVEGRAEVEPLLVTAKADADALKVENQGLKASNEKLTQEKTALDKDLAIEKANSLAEKAELKASAIMTTLLSDSSISETLHVKVKAMVKHQDYIKEGAFDEQAFTAAFKTEVADWETKVPAGAGLGAGEHKEDNLGKANTEEADVEYGKKLAKSFAGKIRSDEK